MGFKSWFVRCLFLSLIVLFVGCAELKGLREEKVLMTQRIDELENETENLNNRYALSEQERARLLEERNRLENTRRSMEQRLRGTGVSVKVKGGHISVVFYGFLLAPLTLPPAALLSPLSGPLPPPPHSYHPFPLLPPGSS
ncbi:MAG: hypothetical protein GY777_02315, partial [Candidatus Brocadiaceae bacterium]|nr:hypothetical protein [Candidatus Brocadiaceae bacterium]